MILQANKVYLLLIVLSCFHNTTSESMESSLETSRNTFTMNLLKVITDTQRNIKPNGNIIFSPISVQSCLTLALMGAEGITAEELYRGLKLHNKNKNEVAKSYGEFVKSIFKATSENSTELHMANRIYVNGNLKISPNFQKISKEYFQSEAESLNFDNAVSAVNKINNWVEEQTNNKIQNILSTDSVDSDTSTILVNAIYFKGKWLHQFSESSTRPGLFYLGNKKETVNVEMMYQDDYFNYGDLLELDASVLEMRYENSDLSMLIILPRKLDGLVELEEKLVDYDLSQIYDKMSGQHVDVFLPKFRIEHDVDLKDPLKKLGILDMFTPQANFNALFEGPQPKPKGAEMKHKAFIDVNEAGSEAAAATYLKIVPMSLNLNQKIFRADHPFFFAICRKSDIYFAGHVVAF